MNNNDVKGHYKRFLERANNIHNNKYDYSKSEYKNANTNIIVTCPNHGDFYVRPSHHTNSKVGCKKCTWERVSEEKTFNTEYFIKKSVSIHGKKYDYSKSVYKGSNVKVEIICKKHKSFFQEPDNHYMGKGCPKCAKNSKLNTDLFIKKSEKKHNKKYEYHKVSYTTSTCPVIITCKKHGDFIQSPNSHLSGKGCSKCQQSHGERLISYELKKNKIVFETQKRFEGCFSLGKNNKVTKLPFDFYLPNLNICIEYDGRQHFMPVKRFGGVKRFLRVKKLDSIKDKFCVTNNIKLVRIPYTDKNNIESIIKNVLLS